MTITCIAQRTSSSKLNIKILNQQHQLSEGYTSLKFKKIQKTKQRRIANFPPGTVLGTGCHSKSDLVWFVQKTALIDKPQNVSVEGEK